VPNPLKRNFHVEGDISNIKQQQQQKQQQ